MSGTLSTQYAIGQINPIKAKKDLRNKDLIPRLRVMLNIASGLNSVWGANKNESRVLGSKSLFTSKQVPSRVRKNVSAVELLSENFLNFLQVLSFCET